MNAQQLAAVAAEFLRVTLVAIVIERIAEHIKTTLPTRACTIVCPWMAQATLVAGMIAAVAFGLDIFAAAGFAHIWAVGGILTGCIVGGGSNLVHDVWSRIRTVPAPAVDVGQIAPSTAGPNPAQPPAPVGYRIKSWALEPIQTDHTARTYPEDPQ